MAFIIILLIIYALGLISVCMMVGSGRDAEEKRRFATMYWNPFLCFFLGLVSPLLLPLMVLDSIFHLRDNPNFYTD